MAAKMGAVTIENGDRRSNMLLSEARRLVAQGFRPLIELALLLHSQQSSLCKARSYLYRKYDRIFFHRQGTRSNNNLPNVIALNVTILKTESSNHNFDI